MTTTIQGGRSWVESAWLVLSSERTTAVLVIVLSVFAGASAFIPQGREALALAAQEESGTIHVLATWGLTDIFASPWMRALAALLAANFFAVVIRAIGTKRKGSIAHPPPGAPYKAELVADLPERAVESLYETFRLRLGTPEKEVVEGSRVTMVFDTSPGGRVAPMLVHLGLMILIAGAALSAAVVPDNHMIVHAELEVKDMSTGAIGTFDIMGGEHFQFFRFPGDYTVLDYVASKDGLGPAIRVQKVIEKERRSDDFWVYLHAPEGFDEKHRRGEVAIRALAIGLVPVPGEGLNASSSAVLLLLGFGLFAFGLSSGRRSEGLLWLEADGARILVAGLPKELDDKSFATRFSHWAQIASMAIKEA